MKRLNVILPFLALALLVSLLSISAVLAAPGGKGKGNHNSASMSVEGTFSGADDLIAWGGEVYTVHGTGLEPNTPINISLASPGCCSGLQVWTDRLGNFSFSKPTGAPGTYTAKAFHSSGNGKPKKVASVSFEVVE